MSQMSAGQVLDLLRQNIGHRVSLQSRTATLSGMIVGLRNTNLIVRDRVTHVSGKPDTPPNPELDLWRTPAQTVDAEQTPGATVLTWVQHIFDSLSHVVDLKSIIMPSATRPSISESFLF